MVKIELYSQTVNCPLHLTRIRAAEPAEPLTNDAVSFARKIFRNSETYSIGNCFKISSTGYIAGDITQLVS